MTEDSKFSIDRFDELAWGYREGDLDDLEVEELNRMLSSEPLARRRFAEQAVLSATLEEELSGESRLGALSQVADGGSFRRNYRWWGAVGAAVAAAVTATFFLLSNWREADPEIYNALATEGERLDESVALLAEAVDPVWAGREETVGSAINPGRLRMTSGLVQLDFYCGATVLLQGEVDLEIIDSDRCILHRGDLRAVVPPQARGFQVESGQLTLIDLGTEFGMRVNESAETEVHVFDGLVQLRDGIGPGSVEIDREITEGRALQVGSSGQIQDMDADTAGFLSANEMANRSRIRKEKVFARWRTFRDELQSDSRIISYFPFSQEDREIRVLNGNGSDGLRTGAIVGSEWVRGRWRGKGALEFKGPADRVRVTIPGAYQSVTLSAWLRVDALDNECNSILMSNGWREEGQVHWQVRKSGQLALAVHNLESRKLRTMWRSGDVLVPGLFGRWQHLAVCYDSVGMEVRHYLNGDEVGNEAIEVAVPIRFDQAEIGNWDPEDRRPGGMKPIRNFNGRIDEIAVFGEALGAEEVRSIFEAGNPRG